MGALKIYFINVSALAHKHTRQKKIISQGTRLQFVRSSMFASQFVIFPFFFFFFILKGLAELTLPFVGQMGLSIFSWGLDTTATMKHVTE